MQIAMNAVATVAFLFLCILILATIEMVAEYRQGNINEKELKGSGFALAAGISLCVFWIIYAATI